MENASGDASKNISEFGKDNLESKSYGNAEQNSVKAIIKHSGEITGYELSNGEKITKEKGVELAKAGVISGVSVSTSRKGEEYLRSLRDDDESNNLSSLPVIDE
ncbi:DUF3892 domain-containing protein [Clostridium sp. BL-8]|uniref:DUF3892 domain-containing protein n=1 Tax=Clostridium sp. BL-8 TaxID=349938 RepID=UPI00098C9B8C|nr:DUF3892 domain-containing protein [Clostridium sp. BL-8]OOM68445.1 hypothetical protein CLOBL_53360 [Clostridium sp. BL-8]